MLIIMDTILEGLNYVVIVMKPSIVKGLAQGSDSESHSSCRHKVVRGCDVLSSLTMFWILEMFSGVTTFVAVSICFVTLRH